MKTNFLNKLKHGLFLFIAVLGTFISYAQSTPTIGGSRIPDTRGLLDIGGKQVPPITPFAVTSKFDVGGIGDVGSELLVISYKSTSANEFGDGQDVPTIPYVYYIGSGVASDDTGQKSFSACLVQCSISNFDIGGNKPPVDEYTNLKEIGGKSTGGETGGRSQEPTLHTTVPYVSSASVRIVYS